MFDLVLTDDPVGGPHRHCVCGRIDIPSGSTPAKDLHLAMRRLLTLTACALSLSLTAALAPAAVAAETDGFVNAENARLGRHRRVAQIAPSTAEERVERYDVRSALVAELDGANVALARQAFTVIQARSDQPRFRRSIRALAHLNGKVAAARADVSRLEADLAILEAASVEPASLEKFGIDFGAFPLEAPTEFVDSWGAARSGGRAHKGTDILAPYGIDVRAIEDGVIERFSSSALGGNAIYLQGDSGARYFYAHLQSFGDFGEGDRVHAGAVIGFNGDSGNARGTPHVHFQWAPEGGEGWRNPYPLLEAIWAQDRQVPLPRR